MAEERDPVQTDLFVARMSYVGDPVITAVGEYPDLEPEEATVSSGYNEPTDDDDDTPRWEII